MFPLDTEFKPAWHLRGEMDEENFVKYRLHLTEL